MEPSDIRYARSGDVAKDLVAGSRIELDRGTAELKGVPREWRLYAVAAA